MEFDEKIPKIDLKKSDPNSDGKPFFFPNNDGKLFFSLITTVSHFFPNNEASYFFP